MIKQYIIKVKSEGLDKDEFEIAKEQFTVMSFS